jgi:ABC-2 type transport system permease protein
VTLVGRELGRLRREPGQIAAALVFPVVMVVLFGYVLGSAIQMPGGGDCREYLMPGLFTM